MDKVDGLTMTGETSVNMSLFLLGIFINLFNNNISAIMHHIFSLTGKLTRSTNYCELKSQLNNLQKECSQIDMTDEFAKYARLQRKIIKLQDKLKTEVMSEKEGNVKKKLIFRVIVGLTSLVTVTTFNSSPVIHMPREWFYPITSILCWPGEQLGSVSFLIWCAISNSVIRIFS